MANPDTLAIGLGDRLRTISGLTVYDRWPNQLNPPCALVGAGEAEPEQALGRGDLSKWDFDIYVFMPLAGGIDNAQRRMAPLLATSSTGGVYGAIHGDRTLAGKAHSTFVKRIGRPDQVDINDQVSYLGAIIGCEVWAS